VITGLRRCKNESGAIREKVPDGGTSRCHGLDAEKCLTYLRSREDTVESVRAEWEEVKTEVLGCLI
jgi:hypothetical protein